MSLNDQACALKLLICTDLVGEEKETFSILRSPF